MGSSAQSNHAKQALEVWATCYAGNPCKAKLVEGQVDMDITHGLEAGELEAGYILTCQAHPISDNVTVDFDQK